MRLFEILKTIDPKLQYHDELNPDIWLNYKLKPVVSKALKRIAEQFFDYLEISSNSVVEVIITGSNCNFNYTPWSDIDLHLIINFAELDVEPKEFLEKYFKAAKTVWNQEHDIKIGDYEVELYAQDSKETHVASGVYSLTKNEWLKKPKKISPKIDDMSVKAKTVEIANLIDSLVDHAGDDPDPTRELKAKIRRMRKAGLSRRGEFSIENLVFKALRNNGYLEKLDKAYKGTIDKELSVSRSDLKKSLNEVLLLNQDLTGPGIIHSAFSKSKDLGKINDTYKVVLFSGTNKQDRAFKKISIVDETTGSDVSWLVGRFLKFGNHNFFQTLRAYTIPEAREKGLVGDMITLLKRKWNVSLLSDKDLTPSGLGLWKRLKRDFNVEIYDQTTGKTIPWTNKSEKELFVHQDDYHSLSKEERDSPASAVNRYYLVIENYDIFYAPATGLPAVNPEIIKPAREQMGDFKIHLIKYSSLF